MKPAHLLLRVVGGLLLSSLAWSDGQVTAESPFVRNSVRYHAYGAAAAGSREEALRLAKAAALERIFREIGKDKIFAEMFISAWPEAIETFVEQVTERDGGFAVSLSVSVTQTEVMLTESNYRVTVEELLNKSSGIVDEIDTNLRNAQELLEEAKLLEAHTAYRFAKSRTNEARDLLQNIGDKSLLSISGKNVSALLEEIASLETRTETGIAHIEKQIAEDESERSLQLLSQELDELQALVAKLALHSPFYDLPQSQLEEYRIDVESGLAKCTPIVERLSDYLTTVPEEKELLASRIDLALQDAQRTRAKLTKMHEELQLEIRVPRLVRQERASRRARLWGGLAQAAKYLFLHTPREILTLHYTLPLTWDMDGPPQTTGEFEYRIRAEGAFDMGLWVEAQLQQELIPMLDSTNYRLSSEVGLGFFGSTLLGAGLGWDWLRRIYPELPALSDEGFADGARELYVKAFLGGMSSDQQRVDWLLSAHYRLPALSGAFTPLYALNLNTELYIRAGRILLLSADTSFGGHQKRAVDLEQDCVIPDCTLFRFAWGVGLGVRLPPPVTIGAGYRGRILADIGEDGWLAESQPHQSAWQFSVEYTF